MFCRKIFELLAPLLFLSKYHVPYTLRELHYHTHVFCHTPAKPLPNPTLVTMQRTRNIDYDNDDDIYDDDDYYEEEDAEPMSVDDKEQMRISTISAREALGEAGGFITDAQIEEALWHYYFDVGKSVNRLWQKSQTTLARGAADDARQNDRQCWRVWQTMSARASTRLRQERIICCGTLV